MIIQVFGSKKCSDTQKSLRFFKERQIDLQFIDLNEKKISKGELNDIIRFIKPEDIIDKNSREYKNKNLQYVQYDPFQLILDNPMIIKTPLIRSQNTAFAGYDGDKLKKLLL